jgi:hypothetical protein
VYTLNVIIKKNVYVNKKHTFVVDDKPENLMALKSILDLNRNYKLFMKLYKFCLRKGFVNTCRCPNA